MADSLYPGSATVNPLILAGAMQPIVQGATKGIDIYAQMRQQRLQEQVQQERLAAMQREEERLLRDRLATEEVGSSSSKTGSDGGMDYSSLGVPGPMSRQELALAGSQDAANYAQQSEAIAQREAAMNPQYLRGRMEQEYLEADPVQQLLTPRAGHLQRVAGADATMDPVGMASAGYRPSADRVAAISGLSRGAVEQIRADPVGQFLLPSRPAERAPGSFDPLSIDRGTPGLENPWEEIGRGAEYVNSTFHARELEAQGKAPAGFGARVDDYNSKLDVAMGREQDRVAREVATRQEELRQERKDIFRSAVETLPNMTDKTPEQLDVYGELYLADPEALKKILGDDFDLFKTNILEEEKMKRQRVSSAAGIMNATRTQDELDFRRKGIEADMTADAEERQRKAQFDYEHALLQGDMAAAQQALLRREEARRDLETARERADAAASSTYAAGRALTDPPPSTAKPPRQPPSEANLRSTLGGHYQGAELEAMVNAGMADPALGAYYMKEPQRARAEQAKRNRTGILAGLNVPGFGGWPTAPPPLALPTTLDDAKARGYVLTTRDGVEYYVGDDTGKSRGVPASSLE